MVNWDEEFEQVLESRDEYVLEIAKQYLEEAGIPAMIDNKLGIGWASSGLEPGLSRLFVAHGMQAQAKKVLADLEGQRELLERKVQEGVVPGKPDPEL